MGDKAALWLTVDPGSAALEKESLLSMLFHLPLFNITPIHVRGFCLGLWVEGLELHEKN